ncbi:hypothetical protein PCYB_007870, partial [Plasmodium cynomolgi strain B]
YFKEIDPNKLTSFTCKVRNHSVVSEKQNEYDHKQPVQVESHNESSVTHTTPQQIATQNANLDMKQHLDVQNVAASNENIQMEDTTEGGHSKSITGSVIPVLGVPFISFLLY